MFRFYGSAIRLSGLVVFAAAISSCGGGGGSHSSNTGVLTYFANFTPGTGTGPTGQSEEVQVVQANGKVIGDQVVNAGAGTQQLTFNHLPNANLYIFATLYAQAGGAAGGSAAQGTANSYISGSGPSIMPTSIEQPITTVTVMPATPSVKAGATVQLIAEPKDSGQNIVFQTAPVWTSSNTAAATVNATSGLVTGVAQGQSTVGASFGGTSTGSTDVSVSASSNPLAQWTIMLFLNSDNDLDAESLLNISQIEKIAGGQNVNFVIQWKLSSTVTSQSTDIAQHPFEGTRRYLAKRNTDSILLDGLDLIQNMGSNVDMGSFQTLNSFITWGEQTYPANHYALVMWDHGNGWRAEAMTKKAAGYRGISYDYDTGNHIDVWQLGAAIGSNHLDILAFDACLMQMLEIQDEVTGRADYMVTAEDNVPGPGYPYDKAFSGFYSSPTASVTSLADGIVDQYINYYLTNPPLGYSGGPLSESVVDLSKTTAVVSALNTFSQALITQGASIGSVVSGVRQESHPYDGADTYNFYDLGSISQRFATYPGAPSAVTGPANTLLMAVQNSVQHSARINSSESTGLSIEFGSNPEWLSYAQYYSGGVIPYGNLQLAQHTQWMQVLESPTINPAP